MMVVQTATYTVVSSVCGMDGELVEEKDSYTVANLAQSMVLNLAV